MTGLIPHSHTCSNFRKKINDFWELGEVREVAIFCLGRVEKVEVDSGWFEARYKTHRLLSYDHDTPSDAMDNLIKPLIWPL